MVVEDPAATETTMGLNPGFAGCVTVTKEVFPGFAIQSNIGLSKLA